MAACLAQYSSPSTFHWNITHTHPTGHVTLTGPDGQVTVPGDYLRDHVRIAYASTVYGTQGATVDHAITLVSGQATRDHIAIEAPGVGDFHGCERVALSTQPSHDFIAQPEHLYRARG